MAKITDTIQPFKTPLKVPDAVQLSSGSHSVFINTGNATIYEHGTDTISVPIWGYSQDRHIAGSYLGASLIVKSGHTVHMRWVNNLAPDARLPFPAVSVAYSEGEGAIPQNVLGLESEAMPTMGHNCLGRFTTHLHGGRVPEEADGWPESMIMPGQKTWATYENEQRPTMLWYHDHAMHTTRLHAYAGMAGAWIITGDDEDTLASTLPLPVHQLPLVIQDRNLTFVKDSSIDPNQPDNQAAPTDLLAADLSLDANKIFNGSNARLLHKIETADGPLEFFGPLNLVNGVIWPQTDVDPCCYRFRILNGANSRTYRLELAEKMVDGSYKKLSDNLYQIGTDGGLLKKPVTLANELILAPAERVDILVDFSAYADKHIVLLNSAGAPFANDGFIACDRLNKGDYGKDGDKKPVSDPELCPDRTPYPEVMMFNVKAAAAVQEPFNLSKLSDLEARMSSLSSFETEAPDLANIQRVRSIGIVEKQTSRGAMLVLWELMPAAELSTDDPILKTCKGIVIDDEAFYVVAERFQDPVNYIIKHGSTEKWRFINLTVDTHPMHMHLVQFQAVSRRLMTHVNGQNAGQGLETLMANANAQAEAAGLVNLRFAPEDPNSSGLDENETGLKDTIRVNPGEMVEVAARFFGYCGRYVYHCHLLEHEDHDMMRQFVVTRDDMMSEGMQMPVSSVGRG